MRHVGKRRSRRDGNRGAFGVPRSFRCRRRRGGRFRSGLVAGRASRCFHVPLMRHAQFNGAARLRGLCSSRRWRRCRSCRRRFVERRHFAAGTGLGSRRGRRVEIVHLDVHDGADQTNECAGNQQPDLCFARHLCFLHPFRLLDPAVNPFRRQVRRLLIGIIPCVPGLCVPEFKVIADADQHGPVGYAGITD